MEFWNQLSAALKQEGFSAVQTKNLQEKLGDLDAAGLLRLPPDQLLAAMTGRTVREKQEKIETLLAVVREIDQSSNIGQTTDTATRRIRVDETRLGRLIDAGREPLIRAEVRSVRDLRRIARLPLDELRQFGFDEQTHTTLMEFAALARVFPPEIAAALLEAGAVDLPALLQWPQEKFSDALYRIDLPPEKVIYEYSRLQRMHSLNRQGSDIRHITGLDIDLDNAITLTAAERQSLIEQRVETLVDWAVMRNKVELAADTRNRLDSCARLYATGAGGDVASRLIEEGLTSAVALARMNGKQIQEISARQGIPHQDLVTCVYNARMQATHVARLVEGTHIAIPGKFPDWWSDVMLPGVMKCMECAEENTAFSRFAYYVYLVQRTGKAVDDVQNELLKHDLIVDLKGLSPVNGAELQDDPLNRCGGKISLLDLIIRHLQAYLDDLYALGHSVANRQSYVYLPYAVWRSERMAFYYPELNALWRDGVLTSSVVPESRGSIFLDRDRERQVLKDQLKTVRDALEQAKIREGSALANFALSSQYEYQDFLRGLAVIEGILGADDLVQAATVQLNQDQAGGALEELRKASIELDRVCAQVFPLDTAWRIEGMSFEEYYATLADVPPAKRKVHLQRAFDELMLGRKRIFEPIKPSSIAGLRNDGSIDLNVKDAWAIDSGWEPTAAGFHMKAPDSGKRVRYLRYKYAGAAAAKHGDLQDYAVHVDFEVQDGSFPYAATSNPLDQDQEFGIMLIARRQTDGSGYRLCIKRKGFYDDLVEPTSYDFLVLERMSSEGSVVQATLLEQKEVGSSARNDIDGRLIFPGHVYRLSLSVAGSKVVGKLRKTVTSSFEVAADVGVFVNGAFAIGVHQDLSVAFSQFEFVSAFEAKGLVPFFAERRRRELEPDLANMSLDQESYVRHLDDGHGMSARLTGIPLVLPAHDETAVSLAGTPLELIFSAGTHWVNNEALDLLLEKCLASLFFLRYAVIPTRTAQALGQRGDYARALKLLNLIYDDTAPGNEGARQIYPKLAAPPDSLTPSRTLSPDVRLLRLRIAGICLDWAEVLFRRNTNESRYQARGLYQRVLALHDNASCDCDAQIGTVTETILERWHHSGFPTPPPDLDAPAKWGFDDLGKWGYWGTLTPEKAKELLDGARDPGNIDPPKDFYRGLQAIRDLVLLEERAYLDKIHTGIRYEAVLERGDAMMAHAELDGMAQSGLDAMLGEAYGGQLGQGPYRRSGGSAYRTGRARAFIGDRMVWSYREFEYPAFCVSPDPLRTQQVKTACLNLELLERCLNILGFSDSLVPPLRFDALLRIARGFADQAHASERDLFQIRQSFEQYSISLQEAESNVALSEGDVVLEQLNSDLAQGNIQLALLQVSQTGFTKDHYSNLIAEGLSDSEVAALQLLLLSAEFQTLSALFSFGGVISTNPLGSVGGGFGALASVAGTLSSANAMQASFERREQEWQFQKTQSAFNQLAAGVGVEQAFKYAEIAGRRQQIAKLKHEFASDAVQFLNHKFLNREMWIWLQRTIREQYRKRLNYAVEMGYMAERALAFEVQNKTLRIIRFDYFDRRRDGLLGATQLQTDLSTLEHTRLSVTRRKLELTRTLSMAQLCPIELEQFKLGAGRLAFSTAMGTIDPVAPENAYSLELFDREFPGQYMRLIKSVKVTVIALIPPHEGIRASLYNSGLSRVVVGPPFDEGFREVTVRRNPERVALSSPFQANGLFNLDYRDDLLLPFEGSGVATDWVFELPKAANRFDFRTIADVLITIEYTALDSTTYRQEVVQRLDPSISADRPFSFRHQFADAWYDLHHPELAEAPQGPMQVSFATRPEDFPPNVSELRIAHVTLYIARKPGVTEEVAVELHFSGESGASAVGGSAATVNGVAGTRQGNSGAWTAMIGKPPVGIWTLALQDTPETRELFEKDRIEDILFVITFGGTTEVWPD